MSRDRPARQKREGFRLSEREVAKLIFCMSLPRSDAYVVTTHEFAGMAEWAMATTSYPVARVLVKALRKVALARPTLFPKEAQKIVLHVRELASKRRTTPKGTTS